jgi:Flp pilus assembly protein TadB
MPKKRRRRRPQTATGQAEEQPRQGWEWRTFPVFFAFAAGLFIASFVAPVFPVNVVVFYVSLAGVAFGLAHILTRWLAVRRAGGPGQRQG